MLVYIKCIYNAQEYKHLRIILPYMPGLHLCIE